MVVSFARFSQLTRYRSEIDTHHGAIVNSSKSSPPVRWETGRWLLLLFTLFRTRTSTTGSFVTTMGTTSVTIQPGKTPNLQRNQLRGSWKPSSSSISLTGEGVPPILRRDGSPDCSVRKLLIVRFVN